MFEDRRVEPPELRIPEALGRDPVGIRPCESRLGEDDLENIAFERRPDGFGRRMHAARRHLDAPAIPFFARERPDESLGFARDLGGAAKTGANRLDLPVELVLDPRYSLAEKLTKRLRPVLANERVGVVACGESDDPSRAIRRDEDVDRLHRGVLPGSITVETEKNVGAVPLELGGLLGGKRRPQRRDRLSKPGLVQSDAIEVPLDDDERSTRT